MCGVVFGIAILRLFVDLGNTMACFDGNEPACTNGPGGFGEQWRSLLAGATLIALAAVAAIVARRHRFGRARRITTLGVLVASATLNCLAAVVCCRFEAKRKQRGVNESANKTDRNEQNTAEVGAVAFG